MCEVAEVRIDVNVLNVTQAITVRRHWEKQGRSDQIRDLDPDVIDAVAKHRHLQHPVVFITLELELLSKNRVRHNNIAGRSSAIGNHEAHLIKL